MGILVCWSQLLTLTLPNVPLKQVDCLLVISVYEVDNRGSFFSPRIIEVKVDHLCDR